MKFLRATLRAFDLESQKRDILKDYVEDYETNVYRVEQFSLQLLIDLFIYYLGKKTMLCSDNKPFM